MSGDNGGDQVLDPVAAEQADFIVSAFAERGISIGLVPAGRGVGYMYAEGQLVVREEHLTRVQEMLPRCRAEHITRGSILVRLSEAASGEQPTVANLLPMIDAELGAGVVTPNHVLTVADGTTRPCPATEPEQVYADTEPSPSVDVDSGGEGVLIYVADTGLLDGAAAAHPWLSGVRGDPDPLPKPLADGTQPIPPYTGHGTFVAGVTRCLAPRADIYVGNVFNVAGSALETDFVRKLDTALSLGVDIFNLSVVSPTRNDVPLQAFRAWLENVLPQYKGVVCVVAAGNSDSRLPEWPAAFPGTVSVGALAADWRSRADFSNFGGWVDVYAPGRDLINAYATGTYSCKVPPYAGEQRKFYGMAKWSGTSFSTPVVTGLIAARMARTGENGRQAADALLAVARAQAIPGVGAVLLPPRPRDLS